MQRGKIIYEGVHKSRYTLNKRHRVTKDKKDFHFRPFYNFRGLAEVSFSLFNLTGYFKEALKSDWLLRFMKLSHWLRKSCD